MFQRTPIRQLWIAPLRFIVNRRWVLYSLSPFFLPRTNMDFSFRVFHHTLVIKIYGALDYSKSLKVSELVKGAKIRYSNVLFDLTKATSIDTSGLGLILYLARHVKKRGGHIRVVNSPQHLRNFLELVPIPGLESPVNTQSPLSN